MVAVVEGRTRFSKDRRMVAAERMKRPVAVYHLNYDNSRIYRLLANGKCQFQFAGSEKWWYLHDWTRKVWPPCNYME